MATIIRISGSLRRGSYNTALLHAAAQLMPDGTQLQIKTISRGTQQFDSGVYDRLVVEPTCGRPARLRRQASRTHQRVAGRIWHHPWSECPCAQGVFDESGTLTDPATKGGPRVSSKVCSPAA